MEAALHEAQAAAQLGEVPVGAAVLVDREIISCAHNETIARHDLTQHAIREHSVWIKFDCSLFNWFITQRSHPA